MDGIIGQSESFRKTMELARQVAVSKATVLITGESGVGKEIVANVIHRLSPRNMKPFIPLNCSAIPENLLESELFGHTKGAFTGAIDKKMGLFEEAEGGTLFLDEIGDLNPLLQAKLLRVLQEKKIKRVGENKFRTIDVRIIAATHKDLRNEVAKNRFRDDLFFRLNVVPIYVPPLRERKEDILPLSEYFLSKLNAINNTNIQGFTDEAKEHLLSLNWRGNVRELENSIERAVVLCTGSHITPELFKVFDRLDVVKPEQEDTLTEKSGFTFPNHSENFSTLKEVEMQYIKYVYEKNNRVKESTAKILGIDRKTLYRWLQNEKAA